MGNVPAQSAVFPTVSSFLHLTAYDDGLIWYPTSQVNVKEVPTGDGVPWLDETIPFAK